MLTDGLAILVDDDGASAPGRAVCWLPEDVDALGALCTNEGLEMPSTARNEPWSGLFIGSDSDRLRGTVAGLKVGEVAYPIILQASYELPGAQGGVSLPTTLPMSFALATPARWVVEFTGEGAPPTGVPKLSDKRGAASQLVAADTLRRWRERALNLVEELARERLSSDDHEERFAGELALAAVNALRNFIETGVAPNRREAWARVFAAVVDFIPKGREGLNLVKAVRDLAQAYDIPVP